MVDVLREAKAFVEWYCDVTDGRSFGPVNATIQALDEYTYIPTQDLLTWARSAIDMLLEEVCTNACGVFTESVSCGDHEVVGDIYDIKQTPPTIAPGVRANIEMILKYIKENLDDEDYVKQLKQDLDNLLAANNLTREDVRFLIEEAGLSVDM